MDEVIRIVFVLYCLGVFCVTFLKLHDKSEIRSLMLLSHSKNVCIFHICSSDYE